MNTRNEKGVTLIELLAAMTITGFIIGLITTLLYQANNSFQKITIREHAQEQARVLTEQIVGKVREQPWSITASPSGAPAYKLELRSGVTAYRYILNSAESKVMLQWTQNGTETLIPLVEHVDQMEAVIYDKTDTVINAAHSGIPMKIKLKLTFKQSSPDKKLPDYETTIRIPEWNVNPAAPVPAAN